VIYIFEVGVCWASRWRTSTLTNLF